ncbi:cytochrome ubiquinol oxidase subunit I [Caulobacter segnis]
MRMEVTSFLRRAVQPGGPGQVRHTVSAGYVIASVFVLGVSAWYLLKGKHIGAAKRSMTVAAAFGLASSLSVVVLGDESGYALTDNQKMSWPPSRPCGTTEPAPAGLTAFGIPDLKAARDPPRGQDSYVLGLIATRSFDKPVEGIFQLVAKAQDRIESGVYRLWRGRDAEGQSERRRCCGPPSSSTAATWATPCY